MKMGNPHVLVVPYPAQGHVIPLLNISRCLANHGFRITFVNTEFNHKRITNELAGKDDDFKDKIHLVSIPDGLELWEDRNELGQLTEAMNQVMPGHLERLIKEINGSSCDEISCVLADESVGWALDVAAAMGIRRAAFWPASASFLVLTFTSQQLIQKGIIDNNGTPIKNQMIQLSPKMPTMNTKDFVWACIGDSTTQKIVFRQIERNNEAVKKADLILCNSTFELEPGAFTLAPQILPIGPLLESQQFIGLRGNFWPEDFTCLKWLDQQPPRSVIYIAFGSVAIMDKTQFQELALGLELSNRPFLWVVRPDSNEGNDDCYPKGFRDRVATRGQMVGWAPQPRVLSHPSIACFLSHCGWNSTMEGVSNGVPFLCWPYFADQFLNESYISDVWKIGLKLKRDNSGIVTREEIKNKVEQLLADGDHRAKATNLMNLAMNSAKEGGSSDKNLKNFIKWMKE